MPITNAYRNWFRFRCARPNISPVSSAVFQSPQGRKYWNSTPLKMNSSTTGGRTAKYSRLTQSGSEVDAPSMAAAALGTRNCVSRFKSAITGRSSSDSSMVHRMVGIPITRSFMPRSGSKRSMNRMTRTGTRKMASEIAISPVIPKSGRGSFVIRLPSRAIATTTIIIIR